MRGISLFFTLYWIIYFPTCIAYNDLPGFSSIDEVMTVVLFGFTLVSYSVKSTSRKPWKEYSFFLGVIAFYVVYSLMFGRNVSGAVWLDFIQEIRPYTIIYCTWILNPQFTKRQKHWMLGVMVLTLASWIVYHPETMDSKAEAEFPVLGQLAICTGMAWYLFTKETKLNRWIALGLVFTGLLAPKFKFVGEVVCFIALFFFMKKKLNMNSPKTIIYLTILMSIVLAFTWQRFDAYYVTGLSDEGLARPMTYKTSLRILSDYFPFGPGMGTFACNGAWKFYSPLYYEYNLNHIWGLDPGGGFICDAYYPTLAQFGIVGVILFCIFWKRRLTAMNNIVDLRYYRVALMTFFCLAIEQTADSSWLSGKGMGYCMFLALCLNANRDLRRRQIRNMQRMALMENRIIDDKTDEAE